MKRTKKTDKKLMFKQGDNRLVLEKKPDGDIEIEIGVMKADDQLFTIANVMSILAWTNNWKPNMNINEALKT